jgi:hypothetical protein
LLSSCGASIALGDYSTESDPIDKHTAFHLKSQCIATASFGNSIVVGCVFTNKTCLLSLQVLFREESNDRHTIEQQQQKKKKKKEEVEKK